MRVAGLNEGLQPLEDRRPDRYAHEAPSVVDVLLRIHVEVEGYARTIELQKTRTVAPEPACFVWVEEPA
jgi:hypothetical protein